MDTKYQTQHQPNTPSLHITVVSAENLSISNHLIKKNAFVTARTDSHTSASTLPDKDGGSYPTWNENLSLPLPAGAQSITVEVHCKTSLGPRMVGMAKVPLSDIVGGYVPAHHVHFLSYRLRQPDGGRNGIINLSVKVVGLENARGQLPWMQKKNVGGQLAPTRKNYVGAMDSGAIAVGIPVGYGYGA